MAIRTVRSKKKKTATLSAPTKTLAEVEAGLRGRHKGATNAITVRLSPEVYRLVSERAASKGVSRNEWVVRVIEHVLGVDGDA